MDELRAFAVSILSGVIAYFNPIAGSIFAMLLVFVANFIVGYLVDVSVNDGHFEFRKAWKCVEHSTIFFLFAGGVYVCGRFNGNYNGAVQCVSTMANVVFYFYGLNILRNIRCALVKGTTPYEAIDFVYYVLSLEFAKKIPGLSEYIARREEQDGKH